MLLGLAPTSFLQHQFCNLIFDWQNQSHFPFRSKPQAYTTQLSCRQQKYIFTISHRMSLFNTNNREVIADFSQLSDHLVVFVLCRGEVWSVKFDDTMNLFQALFRISRLVSLRSLLGPSIWCTKTERGPSKQNIETNEVSF